MLNEIEKNAMSSPDKEREDHEVREGIETVVPDTENPEPGPDEEDEQNKEEE
ncbi:hypothetical protein [Desertivirga xinjiangensis]|uniref:hypothetical protein n=1 Tax=Desertivirga xinjiangensis TaxID=539206 RepID=UPI00210E831C|nr:hypothetical protein [Pedobacter xinjiangensis]